MATRRNTRQIASRAPAKASAASKSARRAATTLSPTPPETSESSGDDDSNDEQEVDDDESAEEDEEDGELDESDSSEDIPHDPALSHLYPFEFDNNDSLTGTDDEMDTTITPSNPAGKEFEKSMEMADMHATMGAHDSDLDDYTAIDDVDDDDDDDGEQDAQEDNEENVLRAAEKDLIAEFEQTETQHDINATLPGAADASFAANEPFAAAGVNLNDDPFQGARFMDDNWGTLWETAELGIWRRPDADGHIPDATRNPKSKRVRFKESTVVADQSSDSNSESEDEEDQFPDIFMDSADPKIQQLLATDTDVDWHGFSTRGGSDAESVYDFEDDADRFAFEMDVDSESDGGDESSSSETEDDGDDTEDETPEEQQAKMQKFRREMKTIFARNRASTPQPERPTTATSRNSTSSAKHKLTTPRSAKGPVQGTFICDPTKATLTTDKATRKTILYPPMKPSPQQKAFWDRAKSASQKGPNTPAGSIAIATRARDATPERPFTAKATLGSMFDGRIDLFDAAPPLPTPTANPFPPVAPSLMSSLSSAVDDISDMDAEYPTTFSTLLNMEHFEDDSSDTDMASAGVESHQPAFLSQGVVGSFRLNQHRAKVESSLASNPAKRASTAEYNALQHGRRGAGNAPITPARKRRTNSDVDIFKTGSGVKKNITPAYSSPIAARRRHSRGQSLSGRLDQTLTPEIWKKS